MNLLAYLGAYILSACVFGSALGHFLSKKEPPESSPLDQLTIKLDRGCRVVMAIGSRMGYRVWVN